VPDAAALPFVEDLPDLPVQSSIFQLGNNEAKRSTSLVADCSEKQSTATRRR
jgi:hypothetical protein